jgi:hypothetical protein
MGRRLWLVAAGVAVALALAAVPAIAEMVGVQLNAFPSQGYYGTDCALQPVVTATPTPGDKVEFQIYDGSAWVKFDDQLVEETGTVDALHVRYDHGLTFPAKFRAIYYDKVGSSFDTGTPSGEARLDRLVFGGCVTRATAPDRVSAGKAFTTRIAVAPNPGPGKVVVQVSARRAGVWKTLSTRTVATSEMGQASFKYTPATEGLYRVRAQFAGNRWAVRGTADAELVVVR